jgi:predicted transcriptional regulator
MSTEIKCELLDFYEFVGQQVADGNIKISPEQALALWHHRQRENEAIREGLRAVEEGRVMTVDEHMRRMYARHPELKDA